MDDRLIVFTRYPEPGKVKTRMIPALGRVGAAELHRAMTEHTVATVGSFHAMQAQAMHPVRVSVSVAGGDTTEHQDLLLLQMGQWLGEGMEYQIQVGDDLGQRMLNAFCDALQGADRAVIIGTDCPGITPMLLADAFARLHSHDIVLGPATDGGYYLIGLRQVVEDLFVGIAWGTDQVFVTTVAIAEAHNLTIARLPVLSDVDRPEDMAVWESINPSQTITSGF